MYNFYFMQKPLPVWGVACCCLTGVRLQRE